jgi:hypothetical protein
MEPETEQGESMKVAFASDERTSVTEFLIRDLEQRNYEVLRFGSIAEGDLETCDARHSKRTYLRTF